jgi:protein-S-isoprenylcysteine O-methyltransferase Ste14
VDRAWRWGNIPVPEAHLGFLVAAGVMTRLLPRPVTRGQWVRPVGGAFLLSGLVLAGWAVRSAGAVDLSGPRTLVTRGAYGRSRHPMYVSWTLIYVGCGLTANTAWPLVLLPALAGTVHREIVGEEQQLSKAFPIEFGEYRRVVPRYL